MSAASSQIFHQLEIALSECSVFKIIKKIITHMEKIYNYIFLHLFQNKKI